MVGFQLKCRKILPKVVVKFEKKQKALDIGEYFLQSKNQIVLDSGEFMF